MLQYIKFGIIIIIVFFPINLIAASQRMPLRYFTADDGLVFNEVITCFQDSEHGYLWFGTYSGLSRFDGKRFVNFTEKNSALKGSIIRSITEDTKHNIWVGYTGGIAKLENNEIINFNEENGLKSTEVISIWPDIKHGIWILTEYGVYYFDGAVFRLYPLDNIDVSSFPPLIQGNIHGDIYVVTNSGIFYKTLNSPSFTKYTDLKFQIRCIRYNKTEDTMYVIGNKALYRLKDNKLQLVVESKLTDNLINFIIGKNRFWLQSETTLWEYKDGKSKIYTTEMLNGSSMSGLLEDREGNIWLTTWGGISMIFNEKIINFTNLPIKIVTRIIKNKKNDTLWLGGDLGVVNIDKTGKVLKYIQTSFAEDIYVDNKNIYVCPTGGFHILDMKGKPIADFKRSISFTYIYPDSHKIWVASYFGLFSFRNENLLLEIDAKHGLSSNAVWSVLRDSKGRLWVGTENGLSLNYKNKWRHFDKSNGLPHNSIWTIYEDNRWGLLFGTSQGICRLDENNSDKAKSDNNISFIRMSSFQDNFISSFGVDKDKNLWIGTDKGVFRITASNDLDFSMDRPRGLAANSTYVKSILIDDPYIYFGTHKGLSRIELDVKNDRSVGPLLNLYQVDINRQPKNLTSLLERPLKFYENNLTFHFEAIYTYLPESITYSYVLEGMDKEWSLRSNSLTAVYTNLNPGSYLFRVQSFAEENKKSPIQGIEFVILPPFWHTGWFICLEIIFCIVFISYVSYIVSRVRLKKARTYAKTLEQMVESRTTELKEANKNLKLEIVERKRAERAREDVERMVRHDLKTPLNGIIGLSKRIQRIEDEEKQQVVGWATMISENSNQILHMIEHSLDVIQMEEGTYILKPSSCDLVKIIIELKEDLSLLMKNKGASLSFTPTEQPDCFVDGEKILLKNMFGNLLKNAIEASPENQAVTVSISTDSSFDKVTIHNFGTIPEKIRANFFDRYTTSGKKGGTGLGTYSARLIAKTHNGDITFTTSETEGTSLIVTLPKLQASTLPKTEPETEPETDKPKQIPDKINTVIDMPLKILVADDNPNNRMIVEFYLEGLPYQIDMAENGQEASDMFKKEKYDIVLMDVQMPIMDGLEATKAIRSYEKEMAEQAENKTYAHVPIIALTADSSETMQNECVVAGTDGFLSKPISEQEKLRECIAKYCNNIKNNVG